MERFSSTELDARQSAELGATSRRSLAHSETFAYIGEGVPSRHSLGGKGNNGGAGKVIMGASAGQDGDVALMEDVPRDKQVGH